MTEKTQPGIIPMSNLKELMPPVVPDTNFMDDKLTTMRAVKRSPETVNKV